MKLWMRATAFLVAAQFLNVQINASMGNRAMAAMTPEYAAAMANAELKLGQMLEGKSEDAQMNFAYKLYKLGVRGRNKVLKMSEEKFQKRLARVAKADDRSEDAQASVEETEMAQDANGIEELGELQGAFAGTETVAANPVMTNKAQFLDEVDPVLSVLGSTVKDNGKLTTAKKSVFKANLAEWNQKEQAGSLRAPASSPLIKLLLKILIITVTVMAVALTVGLILLFLSTAIVWVFVALVITGAVLLGHVNINIRL